MMFCVLHIHVNPGCASSCNHVMLENKRIQAKQCNQKKRNMALKFTWLERIYFSRLRVESLCGSRVVLLTMGGDYQN